MNNKAQAGLEYLLTYGWALILVATIITVLVFVVGKPGPSVVFSVSDPTKFLLKSTGVSGNTAGIVLQNATGGKITIKSITLSGDVGVVSGTKFNGGAWPPSPVDIISGGEIRFDGLNASNSAANSRITIKYKDYADFDRELIVTSGQGGPAGIGAGYSFEGDTIDGSGSGITATMVNVDLQPASACVSGKCLLFDASGDEVSCGINSGLIANSSYTYTAWIKPTSLIDYAGIIAYEGSTWRNAFYLSSTGTLSGYRTALPTAAYSWSTSSPPVVTTNWQFVAASFDPLGDKIVHLYLNGKETNYTIKTAADTSSTLTDYSMFPIKIGGNGDGANSTRFRGYIDEVRIFNRALSSGEICTECKRFAGGPAGVTCNC